MTTEQIALENPMPSGYSYNDSPTCDTWSVMEFRLVYWGSDLKAATSGNLRANEKGILRKFFHEQLQVLWQTHPLLKFYQEDSHWQKLGLAKSHYPHKETQLEKLSKDWGGYIPLVNETFGTYCELDILFLRPEPIGGLISRGASGGDIDNRIKTLFDSFAPPQRGSGETDPAKEPTFVLLSDDSLIGSFNIATDRLLTPKTGDSSEAYVVIHVNIKTSNPLLVPYGISF